MRFGWDFGDLRVLAAAIACGALLIGFAVFLVLASFARTRSIARFGEPRLVGRLESYDATSRRTFKGVLLVLSLSLSFLALARPQFGRGTRLVPATNLDVVIALDYSKSMYARDVVPSRITRAKAEVARLVQQLAGARFGAVAFAGEPMSFPLTSDGAAVAQFFRQLDPNDMPVGGTATARALEAARELLARDPKAKDHVRVIVLVTDGEDLEGDPVQVAEATAQEKTRIDVVQIGGRTPEVIPDVDPNGKVTGTRKDESGRPLTTELSAEGEAQLARIAQVTGGTIVRSEHGETGIDVIARGLAKSMREELAERVETVFAEEFAWPLGAALLLLVIEGMIGEAPRRKRGASRGIAALMGSGVAILLLGACSGWDPRRPFEREAPEVNQALRLLDAGDAQAATSTLQAYLSTGPCVEGNIGTPDRVRQRADGTFDLGLALFRVGEAFGSRFGDEEADAGPEIEALKLQRRAQIDCALRLVRAVDGDEAVELRARARYLEGNLGFLDGAYEDAVKAYDKALILAPGQTDAGDAIGRDAAWNRAIALRRIEDKKDAGPDSGPDAGPPDASSPDAGPPDAGPPDAGRDGGRDGGDREDGGSGKDGGGDEDGGGGPDAAAPPPPEPPPQSPPPRANQDERILDQLENAPTVQQEAARKQARRRVVRGMADK